MPRTPRSRQGKTTTTPTINSTTNSRTQPDTLTIPKLVPNLRTKQRTPRQLQEAAVTTTHHSSRFCLHQITTDPKTTPVLAAVDVTTQLLLNCEGVIGSGQACSTTYKHSSLNNANHPKCHRHRVDCLVRVSFLFVVVFRQNLRYPSSEVSSLLEAVTDAPLDSVTALILCRSGGGSLVFSSVDLTWYLFRFLCFSWLHYFFRSHTL